jgi:alpha-beta hydrolase superfamily lysophospholipase
MPVHRALTLLAVLGWAAIADAQTIQTYELRGHPQQLHLFGHRGNPAVVLSSGDGGWIHLSPHVAAVLADSGYFVVGFDVRAYLASFTTATERLRSEDAAGDYRMLATFAASGAPGRPLLAGVSEGAGLSVLAATDPATRQVISGVLGLGLPDVNELGWRWRDAIIYITNGVPNEPTFSAASLVGRIAPLPLAEIHATRDEFVPLPEVQRVMAAAAEPKRLWVVEAANHRFSDNLGEFDRSLMEAIAWLAARTPSPSGSRP